MKQDDCVVKTVRKNQRGAAVARARRSRRCGRVREIVLLTLPEEFR